ncbi:MAG: hypothetical protein QW328_07270 [Nitrososphaerota archaeon]
MSERDIETAETNIDAPELEADVRFDLEPEIYEAEEAEEAASPPEKVYGDAMEKGFRRVDVTLTKDWLKGWLRGASVLKAIALEGWLTGYFRSKGIDNAEEMAKAITAATFSEVPNVQSQYIESRDVSISREAITALYKEDNRQQLAPYLSLIWDAVRKDSKWYISLTPGEMARMLDIITEVKERNQSPSQAAKWIINEFSYRSPRSLYFNVYYVGRVTGDPFIQAVARELGRVRSRAAS